MPAKIPDENFVEHTREMNRRRAERARQRAISNGKRPLTVWLPAPLRKRLDTESAARNVTMGDLAAALLTQALAADDDQKK